MDNPNDQADGFYETPQCSSESDGSHCFCGKTLTKRKPMGELFYNHQRGVVELSSMPYGMRLSRGFAIISGNKHDL